LHVVRRTGTRVRSASNARPQACSRSSAPGPHRPTRSSARGSWCTAAWFDDIKTGLGLGIGHHSAWKRSAIVTDVDWVGKAYRMFAWMTPGEVKVYGLNQLVQAKRWVAA
jgi:SpoIIAA-like